MYLFLFKFPESVSTKNAAKSALKKKTLAALIYSALLWFDTWKNFSLLEIASSFNIRNLFQTFKISRTEEFSE